ncbi:MAG: peptidylprolyl isomerase [Burkholderiales bacterium]|jgi:peptidyl-prolyl cis-trans isomerase B (cyclophilin B)|nr:peptidylprolyl isomerase [Burkholderiales bacterium]
MKAILNTNMGAIEIELNKEKAPISVKNFAEYVKAGHYDGTIFHRVINDFMIQGGGFDKNMKQKSTNAEIKNEANNGLKNDKYTIAMARTMAPHSASSQFFINVKDNDFLNFKSEDMYGWGYAVFGKVVNGTDIVDKIKQVKTKSHAGHDDVPVEAVVIETALLIEE